MPKLVVSVSDIRPQTSKGLAKYGLQLEEAHRMLIVPGLMLKGLQPGPNVSLIWRALGSSCDLTKDAEAQNG